MRVVVERCKRQLGVSSLHDQALHEQGVLRHRVVLARLGAEATDFREPAGHVLDADVLRARVIEIQPRAGGRVDDVRFGGPVGFHRLSVPRSIRSATSLATSLVGPPDGRTNPQGISSAAGATRTTPA